MTRDSLITRTREAVAARDCLVRAGVRWLGERGLSDDAAAQLVVWAIERATEQRIARRGWPA